MVGVNTFGSIVIMEPKVIFLSYRIRFGSLLKRTQPSLEVHHHLIMVLEADVAAPAVTAGRIDVERGTDIVAIEFHVVVDTICRRHRRVVVAQGYERSWRGTGDVHVGGIPLLVFLAVVVAKEVAEAAFVTIALHHRYHGIEEYLEVGFCVAGALGGYGGRQMSAGREAHDSDIVERDVPAAGIHPHKLHSLLSVADRNVRVAMGHPVFQDNGGNAVALEKLGPVVALLLHCQMFIAATGTYHHGAPCGIAFLWKIDTHLCRVLRVAVVISGAAVVECNIENILRHARNGKSKHSEDEKYFIVFHNLTQMSQNLFNIVQS